MKLEGWIAVIKSDAEGTGDRGTYWIAQGGSIHNFIEAIELQAGANLLHRRLVSIEPLTIPDGGS